MASIDAYKRQLLDSNSSTSSQYSLVKRVAYHLSSRLPSNIAIEDLVQAGMEGLLQAQKVFDTSRGVNFELFAKTRVREPSNRFKKTGRQSRPVRRGGTMNLLLHPDLPSCHQNGLKKAFSRRSCHPLESGFSYPISIMLRRNGLHKTIT